MGNQLVECSNKLNAGRWGERVSRQVWHMVLNSAWERGREGGWISELVGSGNGLWRSVGGPPRETLWLLLKSSGSFLVNLIGPLSRNRFPQSAVIKLSATHLCHCAASMLFLPPFPSFRPSGKKQSRWECSLHTLGSHRRSLPSLLLSPFVSPFFLSFVPLFFCLPSLSTLHSSFFCKIFTFIYI